MRQKVSMNLKSRDRDHIEWPEVVSLHEGKPTTMKQNVLELQRLLSQAREVNTRLQV